MKNSIFWGIVIVLALLLSALVYRTFFTDDSNNVLSEDVYVLRMVVAVGEDDPSAAGARYFADLVESRSDGRIRIVTSYEADNASNIVRQLSFGGIDFAVLSCADLPSMVIKEILDSDVARQYEQIECDLNIKKDDVLDELRMEQLVPLAMYRTSEICVFSNESLDEADSYRIGVSKGEHFSELVRKFGSIPVFVDRENRYRYLNEGTIAGVMCELTQYENIHRNTTAGHVLIIEEDIVPNMLVTSFLNYGAMQMEDKAMIMECASDSCIVQKTEYEAVMTDIEQRLYDLGILIKRMSLK